MSLGGGYSPAVNSAVEAAAKRVVVAVAAGNDGRDACKFSPSSAPSAVTTAATDKTDRYAYFSNYGTCVDVAAPGVGITSAQPDGSTATWSGTSMVRGSRKRCFACSPFQSPCSACAWRHGPQRL